MKQNLHKTIKVELPEVTFPTPFLADTAKILPQEERLTFLMMCVALYTNGDSSLTIQGIEAVFDDW